MTLTDVAAGTMPPEALPVPSPTSGSSMATTMGGSHSYRWEVVMNGLPPSVLTSVTDPTGKARRSARPGTHRCTGLQCPVRGDLPPRSRLRSLMALPREVTPVLQERILVLMLCTGIRHAARPGVVLP